MKRTHLHTSENLSYRPQTHFPTHLKMFSLLISRTLHIELKIPFLHTLRTLPPHFIEQHLNTSESPPYAPKSVLPKNARDNTSNLRRPVLPNLANPIHTSQIDPTTLQKTVPIHLWGFYLHTSEIYFTVLKETLVCSLYSYQMDISIHFRGPSLHNSDCSTTQGKALYNTSNIPSAHLMESSLPTSESLNNQPQRFLPFIHTSQTPNYTSQKANPTYIKHPTYTTQSAIHTLLKNPSYTHHWAIHIRLRE